MPSAQVLPESWSATVTARVGELLHDDDDDDKSVHVWSRLMICLQSQERISWLNNFHRTSRSYVDSFDPWWWCKVLSSIIYLLHHQRGYLHERELPGIEAEKFDGAIFIGYHTSANNPSGRFTPRKLFGCNMIFRQLPTGVLGHTIYGSLLSEIQLNGQSASGTSHYV